MNEQKEQSVPMRVRLMPSYYPRFACTGGDCRFSCCDGGWKIAFNKKDYLKIKRAAKSPQLEQLCETTCRRIRDTNSNSYAEFRLPDGRCGFLNGQNLCSLQIECGHDTLPKVCRVYPRTERYTPYGKECSMTPSCDAVLDLLWDMPDGIDFTEEALPHAPRITALFAPNELLFPEVRAQCVDILQARQFSLDHRMLLLGMVLNMLKEQLLAAEQQPKEWAEQPLDLTVWQQKVGLLLEGAASGHMFDTLSGNTKMFLSNHLITVSITDSREMLEAAYTMLGVMMEDKQEGLHVDAKCYIETAAQVQAFLAQHACFMENLMVNNLFYLAYPRTATAEALWQDYVALCNLYSYYKFCITASCVEEISKERVFWAVARCSRNLLHDDQSAAKLRTQFFAHNIDSLAHMAILILG